MYLVGLKAYDEKFFSLLIKTGGIHVISHDFFVLTKFIF